jgi:hypothetical protein
MLFEKTKWAKHAELQVQNGNEIKKNTPSMTFHFHIKWLSILTDHVFIFMFSAFLKGIDYLTY